MTIGSRLKQERLRIGKTVPDFGALAGAKKNTAIDWQNDVSSPPAAKLAALADAGVDVLYVLTGVRSVKVAAKNEAQLAQYNELVELFWALSDEGRDKALGQLDALLLQERHQGKSRIRRVVRELPSEPTSAVTEAKPTKPARKRAKGKS